MKPVRIDDLFEYSFLSSVEVSPTGEHAAFVVKSSNVEKNEYRSNLYLLHLMRGRVTPLSTSGKDGPFAWDRSGEAVLFVSTRDEDATGSALYRITLAGGEAEHVMTLPHKADSFRPLPDGRILFTARVPLDKPASEPGSDADDYEVLEEIPFWQNGKGFTSRRRVRLFLFDPAGGDLQVLTEPELEVQSYDFIDGQVAFVARRFRGKAALTEELWLYALATSETTCLSRDELALSDVSFLDRDHVLVLASDMGQYGRGQNRELLLYALPDRTSRSLTPHWDRSVGNSVCADCRHGGGPLLRVENGSIYMIITEGGQSKVVQISLSGEIVPVAEPNGSVDAFAVAPQGILCIELHPDALGELYLHDESGERRLTSLNEDSLADRDLSLPEPFTVLHESTKLDAWIVKPIGFDPNARYPTILTVHGGPRAAFGDVFFHEMQCLAAHGYALVYANPRGSSGRGNEFADLRKKYGTIDYEDLMHVLDVALEQYPFLDETRLGIMGGSYGGFMTNWAVGQTDRFKAAVSQRSIANWTSKFNTTDIGYYFNQDALGTTPWEAGGADTMWQHSPLRYADRVSTPTLFIHSEQDYRCWLAEGLQMFTALRYHGVESRLVMFRGENHELSRSGKPKHRVRRLREIRDWFDRYLKA